MTITLSPKARKLVNDRLKSGRYGSPEDVVLAGLATLQRQEELGSFAPGELERLVAEGERSIHAEGVVPAADVFAKLRRRARATRTADATTPPPANGKRRR